MYTISVEGGFRATHHVRLPGGSIEAPHPHNWKVRVYVSRPRLDEIGMGADFEAVRGMLVAVLHPLEHTNLNTYAPLAGSNPTAEVVARFVFDRLVERGVADLRRVEVTEAPGCVASYEIG